MLSFEESRNELAVWRAQRAKLEKKFAREHADVCSKRPNSPDSDLWGSLEMLGRLERARSFARGQRATTHELVDATLVEKYGDYAPSIQYNMKYCEFLEIELDYVKVIDLDNQRKRMEMSALVEKVVAAYRSFW